MAGEEELGGGVQEECEEEREGRTSSDGVAVRREEGDAEPNEDVGCDVVTLPELVSSLSLSSDVPKLPYSKVPPLPASWETYASASCAFLS